ncbi:MAG: metal-sensitive transcriptional regulator, partial [Planctomycetes bacterium]|nr:metal-sensitive transcriptional regulator [Planctomycetota bacterium]
MKKHPSHEDNLVALRRIEGQVRGVQKMVENHKYCIDILNQIYAIKGAL